MRKLRIEQSGGRWAIWTTVVCCALLAWGMATIAAEEGGTIGEARPAPRLAADGVFEPHRLWEAHIRVSAEAWKRMQMSRQYGAEPARMIEQARAAAQPGFLDNMARVFGGGRPATRPAGISWPTPAAGRPGAATTRRAVPVTRPALDIARPAAQALPKATRDFEPMPPGYYGHQYTYARGTLEFNGEVFSDVGIRFKGASSYDTTVRCFKRPFKIDFDRFVDGKLFHGLQQINLQNNACDPSQIRDAISYWAFREAGIPSPRTTFVLLYLTIEGEQDHLCLGVYTLVEEPDKRFLKSRFGSKEGLLVKPEQGKLPYLGTDWAQYRGYQPRTEGTAEETGRMIELARVIQQENGQAFREKIEKLMDVDQFLQYMAVNVMIANLDSLLGVNHNFLLYAPPRGGRVIWLPWDLNLTWGDYQRMGGWDELMDLSIRKPWSSQKPLLDKVLAVPEWRQAYVEHIRRLTRTSLSVEKVQAEIDAMEMVVREADCRAGGDITAGNPADVPWTASWRKPPSPAVFAEGRWESLRDQLADKSAGAGDGRYVPRYRMGGMMDGVGFRSPAPRAPTAAAFAALDTDGNGKLSRAELAAGILDVLFAKADREGKPSISQADVAVVLDDLKREFGQSEAMMSRRMFNRGDQPGTPAATILYEADRDLDGKLAKAEVRATIRRFIYEYDLDNDGQLNPQEFANAAVRFLAGW